MPKSIAGKPAPTMFASFTSIVDDTEPCGSVACPGRRSDDPRKARPFTYQAISRNSRRRILPTGVIGNDSRSTMCFGTLYAVKFSLQ